MLILNEYGLMLLMVVGNLLAFLVGAVLYGRAMRRARVRRSLSVSVAGYLVLVGGIGYAAMAFIRPWSLEWIRSSGPNVTWIDVVGALLPCGLMWLGPYFAAEIFFALRRRKRA